jgi:predicted short-subunit dehydrogenase-like oxidoreductase (DUF2520 family)
MTSLNIIGAGRVGQTLGRLWVSAGVFQLHAVMARAHDRAQQACNFISAGQPVTDLKSLPEADVWLLSVPDGHIAPVAQALATRATASGVSRPALALHCSGALASNQLEPLRQLGWQVASAHPLLSFAQPERALSQFAGTPCALEGDAAALPVLQAAFSQIGARCFALAAQDKLLYHAGAVFATNFLPVLQDLAEQLWQRSGMPADLAQQMRSTLLHNAVNNIVALGPQAALTGPAARGDTTLVAQQGQALSDWNPLVGEAYAKLSALASQLARR